MPPRSKAAELLELHLNQLQRLVDARGMRGVRKLYASALTDLKTQLLAAKASDHPATAAQIKVLVRQVEAVTSVLGPDLRKHLENVGPLATRLGAEHGVREVRAFSRMYAGTTPVLQLEKAARFHGMVEGVDRSLLTRYRTISNTWSGRAISRMEEKLAIGSMTGKSIYAMTQEITKAGGMLDTEQWKAERIVRTEMMNSHSASKQASFERSAADYAEQIVDEDGAPAVLRKKLIETFDDRTGDDSFLIHGQTVDVDDTFNWMQKVAGGGWDLVEFDHPPNRPNDRGTVIPWESTWEETDLERPLTIAELQSAEPTRWRKHPGVDIPPGHIPGVRYGGDRTASTEKYIHAVRDERAEEAPLSVDMLETHEGMRAAFQDPEVESRLAKIIGQVSERSFGYADSGISVQVLRQSSATVESARSGTDFIKQVSSQLLDRGIGDIRQAKLEELFKSTIRGVVSHKFGSGTTSSSAPAPSTAVDKVTSLAKTTPKKADASKGTTAPKKVAAQKKVAPKKVTARKEPPPQEFKEPEKKTAKASRRVLEKSPTPESRLESKQVADRPVAGTSTPNVTPSKWREYKKVSADAPRGNFEERKLKAVISEFVNADNPTAEQQRAVRQEVRELVAQYGLVSSDVIGKRSMSTKLTIVPNMQRNAAASHDGYGHIRISPKIALDLQNYAAGKGDNFGLHALLHEELHGHSPKGGSSYLGVGVVLEEATTEVCARAIMADRAKSSVPFLKTGAYGGYIDAVSESIRHNPSWRTPPSRDWADAHLRRASFEYKQEARTLKTARERFDKFSEILFRHSDFNAENKSALKEQLHTSMLKAKSKSKSK